MKYYIISLTIFLLVSCNQDKPQLFLPVSHEGKINALYLNEFEEDEDYYIIARLEEGVTGTFVFNHNGWIDHGESDDSWEVTESYEILKLFIEKPGVHVFKIDLSSMGTGSIRVYENGNKTVHSIWIEN
ncbi:MAG: hypothetical protein ACPGU5_03320 [Lishizhenia sp.]